MRSYFPRLGRDPRKQAFFFLRIGLYRAKRDRCRAGSRRDHAEGASLAYARPWRALCRIAPRAERIVQRAFRGAFLAEIAGARARRHREGRDERRDVANPFSRGDGDSSSTDKRGRTDKYKRQVLACILTRIV